jgi:hypothetical protein
MISLAPFCPVLCHPDGGFQTAQFAFWAGISEELGLAVLLLCVIRLCSASQRCCDLISCFNRVVFAFPVRVWSVRIAHLLACRFSMLASRDPWYLSMLSKTYLLLSFFGMLPVTKAAYSGVILADQSLCLIAMRLTKEWIFLSGVGTLWAPTPVSSLREIRKDTSFVDATTSVLADNVSLDQIRNVFVRARPTCLDQRNHAGFRYSVDNRIFSRVVSSCGFGCIVKRSSAALSFANIKGDITVERVPEDVYIIRSCQLPAPMLACN